MNLFGINLPTEIGMSVVVGVGIVLALKVIETYMPWLVVDGAGSHIKRADETES